MLEIEVNVEPCNEHLESFQYSFLKAVAMQMIQKSDLQIYYIVF